VLVALAVFATMAALAWSGLNAVARTRTELVRQEDDFRALARAVAALDRDLRAAVARPVRGNAGEVVPALIGAADKLEFTRLGFANPLAEQRANLERVVYATSGDTFLRSAYPVLDRAPTTQAQTHVLRDRIGALRLRYLDNQNRWSDTWPVANADPAAALPRAIELRLTTPDYGEITRTIELVGNAASNAAGAAW
jgi:general secretion pathway protein J